MTRQVEIGAVVDALKLLPAEGILVLDIIGGFGVVRQFIIVYLRPETAQGIYVNFLNVKNSSRQKIPFGIAQIGKAFRNEITPGNFIFRTKSPVFFPK